MERRDRRIRTAKHLAQAIGYILRPEKTGQGVYTGSVNCDPATAYEDMMLTKKAFGKEGGRMAYHWNIDLPPGCGSPEKMLGILEDFAAEYLAGQFEAVYAVHMDKAHLHGHIIFNAVGIDGKKYHCPAGEWEHRIVPLVNRLCARRGLPVLNLEAAKERRKAAAAPEHSGMGNGTRASRSWKNGNGDVLGADNAGRTSRSWENGNRDALGADNQKRTSRGQAIGTGIQTGADSKNLHYVEWLAHKKGHKTWRDMIRSDVDYAIGISYSYPNFLLHLENMGYEVNINGKHLKVIVPGMEKYARVYSMGAEYTEARIHERIRHEEAAMRPMTVRRCAYRGKKGQLPPMSSFRRYYLYYLYLFGKAGRRRHMSFVEKKEAGKIREQMNYLFFKGLHSQAEVEQRRQEAERELAEIAAQKKAVLRERSRYRYVFAHARELARLEPHYRAYLAGNEEYRADGEAYEAHRDWLARRGYGDTKALDEMRMALTARLLPLREAKARLQAECRLLDGILKQDGMRKEVVRENRVCKSRGKALVRDGKERC